MINTGDANRSQPKSSKVKSYTCPREDKPRARSLARACLPLNIAPHSINKMTLLHLLLPTNNNKLVVCYFKY